MIKGKVGFGYATFQKGGANFRDCFMPVGSKMALFIKKYNCLEGIYET